MVMTGTEVWRACSIIERPSNNSTSIGLVMELVYIVLT